MAHTPGPWTIQGFRAGDWSPNGSRVRGADGLEICHVPRKADRGIDQKRDDLLLIAAAPQMLAALKAVCELPGPSSIALALAAIDEAEGR